MTPYNYGSETLEPWYQPYQRYNPFEGVPGGGMGQLAAAGTASWLQQNQGMFPMGFNFGGNPYTSLQRQGTTAAYNQAMSGMADYEQRVQQRAFQGLASTFGAQWGDEQRQAAQNAISSIYSKVPHEIWASRAYDQLSGGMAISPLASRVTAASRHMRDPVTGYSGMSPNSSAFVTQGIYQYFAEKEVDGGRIVDPNYRSRTSGFSMGEVGEVYEQMARRGMLTQGGSRTQRMARALNTLRERDPDAWSRVQDETSVSFTDLPRDADGNAMLGMKEVQKLSQNDTVQRALRTDVTTKAVSRVKEMNEALAAVRDLFGDIGITNAPLPELFSTLERLTSNSVQQVGARNAGMMVRNLRNMAQEANIGMEGMSYLMQSAGQMSSSLGINPAFNYQIAMQGMGMREFMANSGMPMTPAWGLASLEQQTVMAQQRGASAIASPAANRLGALMRLNAQGVLTGRAAEIASDIGAGDVDPSVLQMSDAEFSEMLSRNSNAGSGVVQSMLRQRGMNEEYVFNAGIGDIVFEGQKEDYRRFLLGGDANSAFRRGARLATGNEAVATSMARAAGDALLSMDKEDMASDVGRSQLMAGSMRKALQSTAEGRTYLESLGSSEEEQLKALSVHATNMYGMAQQDFRRFSGNDNANLINPLMQMQGDSGEARATTRKKVEIRSALQALVSGSNDPNVLRRTMRAIMAEGDVDPNDPDSMKRVLGAMLNAPGQEELVDTLGEGLSSLYGAQEDLTRLEKEYRSDGVYSAAEQKDLRVRRNAIRESLDKLQTDIERAGMGDMLAEDGVKGADGSEASKEVAAAVEAASISMSGVTVVINGATIATGGKGVVQHSGNPRGAPPNSGM